VGWAFGWRTLCVAVIYWGTALFCVFGWNGGAFLRQGWLVTAIAGICCLKRDKPLAAGALLTTSAFLRIFPGALLVSVGIAALWHMLRERRLALAPAHRRILMGCLLATAMLGPLSLLRSGGLAAWSGFVENSRVHLATPFKNSMGLRTLLAYPEPERELQTQSRSAIERYDEWRRAREKRLEQGRALYWGLLIAFVSLLAGAVRRQPDWVAAVLGIGLIPIAFELSNYYYTLLLGFGLLYTRKESVGAALCAVAALSWAFGESWQQHAEIFTWCSALVILFAILCNALFLREAHAPALSAADASASARRSRGPAA